MRDIDRLLEYYDELFPVTDEQINFFKELIPINSSTPKLLRIACGTGLLENRLAKIGYDVTGIEACKPLLDSATLRYRSPNMSIRYFQMRTNEMGKFLGKNFFDAISCLNHRLTYISTDDDLKLFFSDCKKLLKQDGKLILDLANFIKYKNSKEICLPSLESIRSRLEIHFNLINEKYYRTDNLHNSSGKIFNLVENEPVSVLTLPEIENYAKQAGFSKIDTFSDYNKKPFAKDSERLICVIS